MSVPLLWRLAPAAVALAYLLWFAGDALRTGFFPDVLMNVSSSLQPTLPRLLLDLVAPDHDAYRPAGALVYRALYQAFHLNPLPYHLLSFLLLGVNMMLLGWLGRLVGRSDWVGLWAMALFSYHAYLSDIYYSSGTLYDLLCFLFTEVLLGLYVSWRSDERGITVARVAALCGLQILAVASKESALLIPAAVVVIELALAPALKGGSWRRFSCAGALSVLAVIEAAQKLLATNPLTNNAAYGIQLSVDRVLFNLRHYGGMLFYLNRELTLREVLLACAGAALIALLSRSRAALVSLALAGVFSLPVLVIDPRSLYVLYLPYAWLCLFAASAIWSAVALLPRLRSAAAGGLFVAILAILAPLHTWGKPAANGWIERDGPQVTAILDQFRSACPSLPAGAKVYIGDDPVAEDDYLLTFGLRLLCRDQRLEVVRRKQTHRCPTEEEWPLYARAFDFKDWKLTPLATRTQACEAP